MVDDLGLPERAVPSTNEPLYSVSIEKNSRGYTWKVSVGAEGITWEAAKYALAVAVADMIANYGGPSGKE